MRPSSLMLLASLAALSLSGCAGSPMAVSNDSPEQLKAENDWALCQAYGTMHSDKVKAEIVRRQLIPADLWPSLEAGKIGVGDSACAAVIAWGQPTQINHTTTAAGESSQWVYERFGGGMNFLYVSNGAVTAIQN